MISNQPIIDSRDDAIPECYVVNMPYIRACTTSAKQTSRGAEDKQEADQRVQEQSEDGAESRGKSKAKDQTLQELVYRQ